MIVACSWVGLYNMAMVFSFELSLLRLPKSDKVVTVHTRRIYE